MLLIKVPATAANLGPGIDSFGIALNLYNEILVRERGEGPFSKGYHVLSGSHLAMTAARRLADKAGRPLPALEFAIRARVPRSRGLGSSATLTVAGLKAADYFLNTGLPEDQLLALASGLEGHPDNAAPALLGGFVITIQDAGAIRYLRAMPSKSLRVLAAVPDFELKTADSRRVLPREVAYGDAVYNVGRASLLAGALITGQHDLLRQAMADRLHQPYRQPLVAGLEQVMAGALAAGAYGVCLSGSGPSVLAFCGRNQEAVAQVIVRVWQDADIRCRIYQLRICGRGAELRWYEAGAEKGKSSGRFIPRR
jgi:homoserine kinase